MDNEYRSSVPSTTTTKCCFYSETTWEFKTQSFNLVHPDVTNSEANTDSHIPLSHLIYTTVWNNRKTSRLETTCICKETLESVFAGVRYEYPRLPCKCLTDFYVFLTVHLSIILDNDNLIHNYIILQYVYYDPPHVSSIICSSSGVWIVLMQNLVSSLSVSGRPMADGHLLRVTIPDFALIQFKLLMMSIYCSKHVKDHNKCIVK